MPYKIKDQRSRALRTSIYLKWLYGSILTKFMVIEQLKIKF